MKILKYVYRGSKIRHDVHYLVEHKYCRYGSDEEPKDRLKKAFNELCDVASLIAGTIVSIRKMIWNRMKDVVLVQIQGLASAANGETMKVALPKIGWRSVMEPDNDGKMLERFVPVGIDDDGLARLLEIEEALLEYVQYGSGQLKLIFELEKDIVKII